MLLLHVTADAVMADVGKLISCPEWVNLVVLTPLVIGQSDDHICCYFNVIVNLFISAQHTSSLCSLLSCLIVSLAASVFSLHFCLCLYSSVHLHVLA